jgi:hypothetical protein
VISKRYPTKLLLEKCLLKFYECITGALWCLREKLWLVLAQADCVVRCLRCSLLPASSSRCFAITFARLFSLVVVRLRASSSGYELTGCGSHGWWRARQTTQTWSPKLQQQTGKLKRARAANRKDGSERDRALDKHSRPSSYMQLASSRGYKLQQLSRQLR